MLDLPPVVRLRGDCLRGDRGLSRQERRVGLEAVLAGLGEVDEERDPGIEGAAQLGTGYAFIARARVLRLAACLL